MTGDLEGEPGYRKPDLSEPVRDLGTWDPKGVVAVVDTSVLVAARITVAGESSPSRQVVSSAAVLYDSFTSPEILEEVEGVLARPRFGYPVAETRKWLDVFLRHSRQVDPESVPGDYSAALGDDEKDNPVFKTALAVNLHEEGQVAVENAKSRYGCFLVSMDRDFEEGRTVWGWKFIRPASFWRLLLALGGQSPVHSPRQP
jgi:predicted nucleic acid-binding protein